MFRGRWPNGAIGSASTAGVEQGRAGWCWLRLEGEQGSDPAEPYRTVHCKESQKL